jgi:hypothetical protein
MTGVRWQASFDQLQSLDILHSPVDVSETYTLSFVQ